MTAAYTIDVVRTIRRNAGTVPPEQLAQALGWSLGQLERIAAKHHISLRLLAIPIKEDAPPRPNARGPRGGEIRTGNFSVNLREADAAICREKAAARFMPPGRLIRMVFEGAIARGKIDDLATAAMSYRPNGPANGEGDPP